MILARLHQNATPKKGVPPVAELESAIAGQRRAIRAAAPHEADKMLGDYFRLLRQRLAARGVA